MKLHRLRSKAVLDRVNIGRSVSVPAVIFGLVAVLVTAQAISQTRMTRDVGALPQSATVAEQAVVAPPFEGEAALSAAVPTLEEASLATPIPFSTLAAIQAGNQSASESSSQSTPAPTTPKAAKIKPQHHAIGVTLVILGGVTLAAGATAYALGRNDFCANEKTGGCPEARDAGLILMPVGGAVTFTGFYFIFHR